MQRSKIINTHKMLPILKLVLITSLVLIALTLVGCSSQPTPEPVVEAPTAVPTEAPAPTQVPTEVPPPPEPGVDLDSPEYEEIMAARLATGMGHTYDDGKGPNTYCSRCHSPQNWDPEATTDASPNCVTCKFATEDTMRIATTMDFVPEEDWKGIGCETCHQVVDGRVLAETSWLNPLTMEYEEVNNSKDLCAKCHADTKGVSATGGRGVSHAITLGGSAHLNWAGALPQDHRPDSCSDCHDPHSLAPKDCIDCHEDVLTLDTHMKGTSEFHANLDCLACHDASGSEVGPIGDEGETPNWTTVLTSVSRKGVVSTSYVKSHSVMWQVDCSRCHFEENPWELPVLTEDGELVEPES